MDKTRVCKEIGRFKTETDLRKLTFLNKKNF